MYTFSIFQPYILNNFYITIVNTKFGTRSTEVYSIIQHSMFLFHVHICMHTLSLLITSQH